MVDGTLKLFCRVSINMVQLSARHAFFFKSFLAEPQEKDIKQTLG